MYDEQAPTNKAKEEQAQGHNDVDMNTVRWQSSCVCVIAPIECCRVYRKCSIEEKGVPMIDRLLRTVW